MCWWVVTKHGRSQFLMRRTVSNHRQKAPELPALRATHAFHPRLGESTRAWSCRVCDAPPVRGSRPSELSQMRVQRDGQLRPPMRSRHWVTRPWSPTRVIGPRPARHARIAASTTTSSARSPSHRQRQEARVEARLLHFWSAAGEADVRLRLNLYHLKSVAVLVPATSRTDPVGLFR